jgi:hypothetical protein
MTDVGRLGKLTQEGAGRRHGRYSQPIRPGTPTTQDNVFFSNDSSKRLVAPRCNEKYAKHGRRLHNHVLTGEPGYSHHRKKPLGDSHSPAFDTDFR